MSVDIGDTIGQGFRRTVARNGLLLIAVSYVLGVINELFATALVPETPVTTPGPGPGPGMGEAVSLSVSSGVASAVSLVVTILTVVVSLVALRTFVSQETEGFPDDAFSRNLLWATVNLIVGGIVFVIVVGIGLIFLIIPGLFLLVSLYFWSVYVAVEDQNFVEGFQNSWELTRGERLSLFALGFLVVVIVIVVNLVFGIPAAIFAFLGGGFLQLFISQIGSAFASIFITAATARAYVQLTAEEEDATEAVSAS